MTSDITPTVAAIGELGFEGHVIPHLWFQRLTLKNGKPDLNAIIILADVVYWYRPRYERDEATGKVTAVRKRFKADKLQRSYDQFGALFGFGRSQVKRAIDRLTERGILTTEFRMLRLDGGAVLPNALFLEPVPEAVRSLSSPEDTKGSILASVRGVSSHRCQQPLNTRARTGTETTPKSTSREGRAAGAASTRSVPADFVAPPRMILSKKPPQQLFEYIVCGADRPRELILDLRSPLHYYTRNPPTPSALQQLRRRVREAWTMELREITQAELDAAAIEGLDWWKANREGDPRGLKCYFTALDRVLAGQVSLDLAG